MSYTFGKTSFCDESNISASRAYINNALVTRGLVRDGKNPLKFNSADAPEVMNLIYDFLRKSEQEDAAREQMSAKIRETMAETERMAVNERQHLTQIRALQKEVGVLKNHVAHDKDDLAKTQLEMKQLRESLAKTTAALNHTKLQTSNDLRKRDAQIARMKEHLVDGGTVRRSKASSSMTIKTSVSSINQGPPTFASYAQYNPAGSASLSRESDDQLTKMVQEVSQDNDQLVELLQATLTSLDALVQIEAEERPLVTSTAQSIIMLEAQLKVRLTALRNILDMPNYVPIEEVEARDGRIRDLQQRLVQIEGEWSAAQNVLKGLTASVLQDANPKKEVKALGEWSGGAMNARPPSPDRLELLKDTAKTPIAISIATGKHPKSTVKIDSRLLRQDMSQTLADDATYGDSTPIRARKEKAQRKNRRVTLGLLAREEDLHAELESVLSEAPQTPAQ